MPGRPWTPRVLATVPAATAAVATTPAVLPPDAAAQSVHPVVHRPVPTAARRATTRRPTVARRVAVNVAWTPILGTGRATTVVTAALAQVGKPYVWAGTGPYGFDCSGLIAHAFAAAGISLPHRADSIGRMGRPVPRSQWQPGTVIAYPGHVALYIGGGMMVEAAHPGTRIRVVPVRPGAGRWLLG